MDEPDPLAKSLEPNHMIVSSTPCVSSTSNEAELSSGRFLPELAIASGLAQVKSLANSRVIILLWLNAGQ